MIYFLLLALLFFIILPFVITILITQNCDNSDSKVFFINLLKIIVIVEIPFLIHFLPLVLIEPKAQDSCSWINLYFEASVIQLPLLVWFFLSIFHDTKRSISFGKRADWVIGGIIIGLLINIADLYILYQEYSYFNYLIYYIFAFGYILYKLIKETRIIKPSFYIFPLTIFIASFFGFLTISFSKYKYCHLPEHLDNCFIVSTASKGHTFVVHSYQCNRTGKFINKQLIRFKLFEIELMVKHSLFHSIFRVGYNFIGPLIASLIKNKFIADIIYILLKPLELIVVIFLFLNGVKYTNNYPSLRSRINSH